MNRLPAPQSIGHRLVHGGPKLRHHYGLQIQGVERYGFHGLSCESVVRQLGASLPGKPLIAHLGNGAGITAVRNGRSIDTSMGLTPTGGIDAIVFTGGIGHKDAPARVLICRHLAGFGALTHSAGPPVL
jgi:acetate kinase